MLKKEPISVKLPKWLIEWMDAQPESRAVLIEDAICKRHKIKPPADGGHNAELTGRAAAGREGPR